MMVGGDDGGGLLDRFIEVLEGISFRCDYILYNFR